jgi:hypothetical protein
MTMLLLNLGRVVADEKLDIAILSVDASLATTYPAVFFDVVPGGSTPPEGTDILATGFPRDIARATGPGALTIFSHTEWFKGPSRRKLGGAEAYLDRRKSAILTGFKFCWAPARAPLCRCVLGHLRVRRAYS